MTTLPQLCARLAETLCLREAHVARHARALQRAGMVLEAGQSDVQVTLEGAIRLLLSLAAAATIEAPETARKYAVLTIKTIGNFELTAFGSEQTYLDPDESCRSPRSLMDILLAAVAGYSNSTEAQGPKFTCNDLHLGHRPDGALVAALDGTSFDPAACRFAT